MLQRIHDHSHGWLSTVVIGIICLTFIFWGVHSYVGESEHKDIAATVNGNDIHQGEMTAAYERLAHRQQIQLGSEFSINPKSEKQLKKQALNQLISTEILTKAAQNEGLRFTMDQLYAAVIAIPSFQVDGKFSQEKFKEALDNLYYSRGGFLNDMHASMLINQMRIGVINSAFALPNEVDQTIRLVNQKRDFDYFLIPYRQFISTVQIPESEIQAYYHQHENDFKTPEQISLEYVELSQPDFKAHQKFTEAELLQFYKDNLDRFIPKGKTEPVPFEKVKDQVKQTYAHQKGEQEYSDSIETLANLTYTNPDTLKTAAEGLTLRINKTPLFTRSGDRNSHITSNQKVLDEAFSNEVLVGKTNSRVIELNSEHAIVLRIKEHVPAALIPLDKVRSQIENQLKIVAAQQKAKTEGENLLKQLQSNPSQTKIAWIKKTGMGRNESKMNSAVLQKAFQIARPTKTNQTPTAGFELPNKDYVIIKLLEVKDGEINHANESQQRVFQAQIQQSFGQLDYELYVQGLIAKAEIDIKNEQLQNE